MEGPKEYRHDFLLVTAQDPRPTLLFNVLSESAYAQYVGGAGIGSKLVCNNEYTKDLPRITKLPYFPFRPHTAKDRHEAQEFMKFLSARNKAAKILINRDGWIGYLFPSGESNSIIYCYYEKVADKDGGRPAKAHEPVPAPAKKSDVFDVFDEPPAAVPPVINSPFGPVLRTQGTVGGDASPSKALGILSSSAATPSIAAVDPFAFKGPSSAARTSEVASSIAAASAASAQAVAAQHYNALVRTREGQADSFIYHMKRFNNWVKGVLIDGAVSDRRNGARILDLACGKGGDLGKWARYRIAYYVGMDIAKQSLNDLIVRMQADSRKWSSVPTRLVAGDLALSPGAEVDVWASSDNRWTRGPGCPPEENSTFDVASMQFALHYMAESEAKMGSFLHFVSNRLRPGGTFIATTTDARVLVELLMGHSEPSKDGETLICDIKDKAGRCLATISFSGDARERILRPDGVSPDRCSPMGIRYHYTLREEVQGQQAVDAPEWMIPLPVIKRLAAEAGLRVDSALNFHEFYEKHLGDSNLMRMLNETHATDFRGTMDPAEWSVARIYMTLVLVKDSSPTAPATKRPRSCSYYEPRTPDHPPPGWDAEDHLPESPPYFPQSPPRPPPGWRHSSTGMGITPVSPTGPPPPEATPVMAFAPTSPPGPPPPDAHSFMAPFAPISPPGPPPPDAASFFAPVSPPGPPPEDGRPAVGEEDDDEAKAVRMLRMKKKLREQWGRKKWDALPRKQQEMEVQMALERDRD